MDGCGPVGLWVQIGVEEHELRKHLKSVQAQYDPQRRSWRTTRSLAHHLGLADRIVGLA